LDLEDQQKVLLLGVMVAAAFVGMIDAANEKAAGAGAATCGGGAAADNAAAVESQTTSIGSTCGSMLNEHVDRYSACTIH
jgi:hypothetical protein